ncbi:hypothetical protein [Lactobacillus delbrueckii]|uniref:hypothetical protein n=1 Tax=Lactobacillus delbrueckii TaxID=1584 RepID=UPI001EE8791D|nr:hypothetical protein [Lactobacillus delbrueckii]
MPDPAALSGIIMIGYQQYSPDRLNEVKKSGLPLVFVDTDTLKLGYCSVVADFGQAIQEALEVFWGQGKERIALLDGDLDSNFLLDDDEAGTYKVTFPTKLVYRESCPKA